MKALGLGKNVAQTLMSVHASFRFQTGTGKSACATKFNGLRSNANQRAHNVRLFGGA